MAPRRPAHLDLNRDDFSKDLQPPKPGFHMELPSPRTGEAPPLLSPLDAFAMHSRMLAKRFEDEAQKGRRISRLPHTDVAKELANRGDYFRTLGEGREASGGNMGAVPEEGREDGSPTTLPPDLRGLTVAGSDEKSRPISHYPVFGDMMGTGRSEPYHRQLETPLETPQELYDAEEERESEDALQAKPSSRPDYFGISAPRASSPEPVESRSMINVQAASPINMPSLTSSVDSVQSGPLPQVQQHRQQQQQQQQGRSLTNGSTRSMRSLAPPKSPAFPKSPRSFQSIRSVRQDSGDEEASISGAGSSVYGMMGPRKLSSSSGMSRPHSPFSPFMQPHQRSPSMTSEYSINGSQRRTNFSRPLSSASNRTPMETRPSLDARPSFESRSSYETRPSVEMMQRMASSSIYADSTVPFRQASQDDSVVTPFADQETPAEITGADYFNTNGSTYTYSKYALPRGRNVERNSRGTRDSWIQKQFTWDDEQASAHEPLTPDPYTPDLSPQIAHSPPSMSESSVRIVPHQRAQSPEPFHERTQLPEPVHDTYVFEPPPRVHSPALSDRFVLTRSGRDARPFSSSPRSQSADRTFSKSEALHRSTPSTRTRDTDSTERTVRGASSALHERTPSADLTPDEHLDLGIRAHSANQLRKSTYHLRLAAMAGLPTAMLLYALACRHGWGMRPNQAEGVRWLRKAIDGAGIEVADVETTLSRTSTSSESNPDRPYDPAADAAEKKKRKAQFALAIYELGISYMNGWGCQKDKALALRCYEVAGSWGDCDALAEAGFCYTQGIGCKKDLKKAAALYRQAAEGGMEMAGNSWIYKPKYMDDTSSSNGGPRTPEKKSKQRQGSAANANKDKDKERELESQEGRPTTSRSRAKSFFGRKREK